MTLNERTAKFAALFMPIRLNPALAQRVQGWVFSRTGGKKLPEFLGNGSPEDVKAKVLDDLIEILEKKDYEKLPACPSGQAAPTGDAGAPPAAPKAIVALTPAPVEEAAPEPKPEPKTILTEPVPRCFVQTPAAAAPVAPVAPAVPVLPAPADPAAALAALIRQMIPAPAPAAAPSPTPAEIRQMVRQELADALTILAGALRGAK